MVLKMSFFIPNQAENVVYKKKFFVNFLFKFPMYRELIN